MVNLYLVGGAVRDLLMAKQPHDYDFTVEASSYEEMKQYLLDDGFTIFVEHPEFFTIRGRFPSRSWKFGGRQMATRPGDFVLARQDGTYTDGRRPDTVMAGTLLDDLRRRDFTINAIAQDINGEFIDPFNGFDDIKSGIIRAVGSAQDRISEDPLRALRAIRFAVTKKFRIDDELNDVLRSYWIAKAIDSVAIERVREEMHKAFSFDTQRTLAWLNHYEGIRDAIFGGTLWLEPTLKAN